ncbi:MAG: ChbG/HpnK family deacetylase [Sandaracinaceae bacterium]
MPTALIIVADDLGLDPRRDAGIADAFRAGAITQASFMVKGPSAEGAAELARAIGLPLGLHLDLTETAPAADPSRIASLLDAQGNKRGKHGLRDALAAGAIDMEHVAVEARAQIEAFASLIGASPRHVDGHQHAHCVPALAETLASVLAEAGVESTRIPEQRDVHVADPDKARFYRGVSDDGARARAIYAARGIRSTAAFVGLDLMGAASSEAGLHGAVAARVDDAASIELMCHPGYPGETWDDFNRSPEREHELRVLLAQPFRALVREGKVRLSDFGALAAAGALT